MSRVTKQSQSVDKSIEPSSEESLLISKRLAGIDILRGFAVCAVVLHHIPHYAMGGYRENPFFLPAMAMDYGYLGVPLFVLISGFCIHRRAAIAKLKHGNVSLNWVEFWKRRFWRLYPCYFVAMILSVSAGVWFHTKTPNLVDTLLWDSISHLLMIHNLTANFADGMGNGAYWSLGMEEQLYLLYLPLFFLIRKDRRGLAIAVVAAVTVLWRFLTYASPDNALLALIPMEFLGLGAWGLWPFAFWLHWTLGALAVDGYFGNCRLPNWCSSLVVASLWLLVGLFTNQIFFKFLAHTSLEHSITPFLGFVTRFNGVGELSFAVSFFCLLNWLVKLPDSHLCLANPLSRIFGGLGKISYSIYLIHIPVIYFLGDWLLVGHSPFEWISRVLIYLVVTITCSSIFYFLIERWFLNGRCPWKKMTV